MYFLGASGMPVSLLEEISALSSGPFLIWGELVVGGSTLMLSKYLTHSKCSMVISLVREQSTSLARHLCLSCSPEREMCHLPAMSYHFHVGPWAGIHCFVFVFKRRQTDMPCSSLDFRHKILVSEDGLILI